MTLKDKIFKYFDTHPIDDSSNNKYDKALAKFKISRKVLSNYWNRYKKSNRIEYTPTPAPFYTGRETSLNQTVVNTTSEYDVRSVEELMAVCEVDPTKFSVISWKTAKRDVKVGDEIHHFYSIEARFKPIPTEENLELQKQIILDELFTKSPRPATKTFKKIQPYQKTLLEITLFDVHFGKKAYKKETGEDYNLEIATKRWFTAIDSLLSRINLDNIERIVLPIGNDLIHVDNFRNQTTAGTPQDTDGKYYFIVKAVKEVLIKTIDALSEIAPVDVISVPGNHDSQTMLLLSDIIDAYYHNNKNVTVFNEPSTRKYYSYGNVSIMYTHGDKERLNELGMIFATENPKLWAKSTQRYIKIGHLHHNKRYSFNTQEFQGFTLQVIPSLSSSDKWHSDKGYNSLKQAKAFLYNIEEGLIGEFSYTVK